jgi:hypothetical protein
VVFQPVKSVFSCFYVVPDKAVPVSAPIKGMDKSAVKVHSKLYPFCLISDTDLLNCEMENNFKELAINSG